MSVAAILLWIKARAWAIPWALAALGAAGTLWYRDAYHTCELAREADRTAAEKAKAEALADAQRRSDAIVAEQSQALARIAQKASSITEQIRYVPVQTACVDSPAVRLGIGGVRDIIGSGSGGGPAKAVGSTPTPLQ